MKYAAVFHCEDEEWSDAERAAAHAEEKTQIEWWRLQESIKWSAGVAMVSVGCGWCVWRSKHDAPTEGEWCYAHIIMVKVKWISGNAFAQILTGCGCLAGLDVPRLHSDHHGAMVWCNRHVVLSAFTVQRPPEAEITKHAVVREVRPC